MTLWWKYPAVSDTHAQAIPGSFFGIPVTPLKAGCGHPGRHNLLLMGQADGSG